MMLFSTTVKVKRLKATSGNNRGYVATATGEASIQPIAKEPNEIASGQFGTLYVAYVEVDLPAQRGDKLTDPNGTVYIVKEVMKREQGAYPHQELTLTRE
jgi:hypothetical protein